MRDDALPDATTSKSKLYHIYRDPAVAEDLNRKALPHEALPKLVKDAYTILGADWRAALKQWQEAGHHSPPVLLTVCNRTETAARIEHYFNSGDAHWPELCNQARTLRVDSRVMEKAEIGATAQADKPYETRLHEIVDAAAISQTQKERLKDLEKETLLREIVDTVGRRGSAGQGLQKVISVAMLSEGWDAKNVTHIMGLRAFTSQLLCEQVIGRGLRRVSYETDENGLFLPEYVNVFGVPLSIYEAGETGDAPPPPKPSTQIDVVRDRAALEIRWPNVLRVETVLKPELIVDWKQVEALTLDPAATVISAEIAPAIGAGADLSTLTKIDLSALPDDFRLQRLTFVAARKAFREMQHGFKGNEEYLLLQLVRIIERFLGSDKLVIPSLFHNDPVRRRVLIGLNIDLIVTHILRHVNEQNIAVLAPVYDEDNPIGSTSQMRTWFTTKPSAPTTLSHISHVVGDSSWEQYVANALESREEVSSYAKNDHLGFHIPYLWQGSRRLYVPDFIVRLASDRSIVLEIKGIDTPQNKAKREALDEWVEAINGVGSFGRWGWDVIHQPFEIHDVLTKHFALPRAKNLNG